MRRAFAYASLLGAGVIGAVPWLEVPATAAASTALAGHWSGSLHDASNAKEPFTVRIAHGARSGTWRISADCHGTFRLKDISNGYHHYYRLGGHGCSPAGVDCFERASVTTIVDVFVSDSGKANETGTLKRG